MAWRVYRSYLELGYRTWRTQGIGALLKGARRRWQRSQAASWSMPPLPSEGGRSWRFTSVRSPDASVLVLLRGAQSAARCLQALAQTQTSTSVEVIAAWRCDPDSATDMEASGVNIVGTNPDGNDLDAWNRLATQATGRYLLLLTDDVLVVSGWLEGMLEAHRCHFDAGIVIPRLISESGELLAAGVRRNSRGECQWIGNGSHPLQPEYSFARVVPDFVPDCALISKQHFARLMNTSRVPNPTRGTEVDLAERARAEELPVVYEPAATAVYVGGERQQGNLERTGPAPVGTTGQGGREGAAVRGTEETGDHVLFVDSGIPTPDRDSGSLRTWNLIELFREVGYRVTFAGMDLGYVDSYVGHLQACGVEVLYRPFVDSLETHLKVQGSRYSVIVLSHPEAAEPYMEVARRCCPNATIVYDSHDLRFVREEREAELYRSASLRRSAARRKRSELELIREADVTWVVSPIEKELLHKECAEKSVEVVSNIFQTHRPVKAFESRKDLLFLGNYRHPPNVDAVKYLVEDIFPLIRERLPGVRLYVVGSHADRRVTSLAKDDVEVTGYVPDVAPYFTDCRVFLAPLRYGAGVKGKVNMSMSYGLPVVGTTVAVEGMGLRDECEAMVADEPEAFAEKVVRVYEDGPLWRRLSEGALEVLERTYSRDVPKAAIERLRRTT